MAGVSRNSFHLLKGVFAKLKGKFLKALIATLIMVAPLMLCCFTIYGVVAAIAIFGVFQVGYIRYMRALLDDQNPSYALIFSEFAEPWLEVFLGILLISMYAIGYVAFLIPGVILVGLFSMSFYFADYKKTGTPFEAMKYSVKYMKGNYTNMFGFKVLFWLAYIIVLGLGALGVIGVIKLWAGYKLLSILLLVLVYVLVTFVWSVVTVFYQTTQELFFRELLLYSNYRESQKNEKQVVIIEEEKSDVKPVENAKEEVEVEKVVEKKAPVARKTTTAKTSTKSTIAKTSTRSTSSAKTTTKTTTTAKATSQKKQSANTITKKSDK